MGGGVGAGVGAGGGGGGVGAGGAGVGSGPGVTAGPGAFETTGVAGGWLLADGAGAVQPLSTIGPPHDRSPGS